MPGAQSRVVQQHQHEVGALQALQALSAVDAALVAVKDSLNRGQAAVGVAMSAGETVPDLLNGR